MPLKRIPSDFAHGVPEPRGSDGGTGSNGALKEEEGGNGSVDGRKSLQRKMEEKEEQAGVLQLAICVGGIYASLYVLFHPFSF